MRDNISDLANWPKRRSGQPIIKSTNEAFLYAQLVYDNPPFKFALMEYRDLTYKQLKVERTRRHPNCQNMMDMAVRAQLFREAFMEALRIEAEDSKATGG